MVMARQWLFLFLVFVDNFLTTIEAVSRYVMAAVGFTRGGVLGQGRSAKGIV